MRSCDVVPAFEAAGRSLMSRFRAAPTLMNGAPTIGIPAVNGAKVVLDAFNKGTAPAPYNKAGFGGIAPWRREVEGQDVRKVAKHIHDAWLQVTGYCRSTYIPALTRAEFDKGIQDNYRALDEAALEAALGPGVAEALARTADQLRDDAEALAKFASQVDVATFEFENIAADPLEEVTSRVPFWPPLDALCASADDRDRWTIRRRAAPGRPPR